MCRRWKHQRRRCPKRHRTLQREPFYATCPRDAVRASERLRQLAPDLCVLFMSGYPDEALGRHGVLEPGIHLLPKPFTGKDLTQKVREVLDGRARLLAERSG